MLRSHSPFECGQWVWGRRHWASWTPPGLRPCLDDTWGRSSWTPSLSPSCLGPEHIAASPQARHTAPQTSWEMLNAFTQCPFSPLPLTLLPSLSFIVLFLCPLSPCLVSFSPCPMSPLSPRFPFPLSITMPKVLPCLRTCHWGPSGRWDSFVTCCWWHWPCPGLAPDLRSTPFQIWK